MTMILSEIFFPPQVGIFFEDVKEDRRNYGKIKPEVFTSIYSPGSFMHHSTPFYFHKREVYKISVKNENPPEFLTFIREKLNEPYFKWEEKTEYIGGPSCHDYDYTARAFYFIFTPQKD